jgi:hypothetical protein
MCNIVKNVNKIVFVTHKIHVLPVLMDILFIKISVYNVLKAMEYMDSVLVAVLDNKELF